MSDRPTDAGRARGTPPLSSRPPRQAYRIGVVAGTRPEGLDSLGNTLGEVDLLLHAGRIGGGAVYDELERRWPLRAVIADEDYLELGDRVPETRLIEFDGLRILLTHLAGDPPHLLAPLARRLEREPADLLVHGQPPQAQAGWLGGLLVVAPGHAAIRHPGLAPTCAVVEAEGGTLTAHLLELGGRHPGLPSVSPHSPRVPRRLPR